jgi:3-oxoacyl-[acyl-carrier-protein] synthase II
MKLSRRVVVTGVGILCPVGIDLKSSWQAIKSAQSGITLIEHFDTTGFATRIAGLVPAHDSVMDPKDRRRMDTFIDYGVCAAHQALMDSGLLITDENAHRVGVAIGSGIGGLSVLEKNILTLDKHGPRKVSPFYIPGSIINMCSGYVSQFLNCQGPNYSLVSACASGAHSIGYAARSIAYGDADVMLAGGTEGASTPSGIAGFSNLKALSRRNDSPSEASRPWDSDRDGFVLGDGAGVVVLEEYESAKARGAEIYGELIGFGMSGDAHHITAAEPNGRGMYASMQNALADAGINPDQLDYINAHGTSTPLADPIEHAAVKRLLGDGYSNTPMSSTKSMTGHLLGAAGAIEAIFSLMSIRDNVAPPTINLQNPADGCDMNLVPQTAQERSINHVLSNSFGFGGTNVSLVFSEI